MILLLAAAIGILAYVLHYNAREQRIANDFNTEEIVKAISDLTRAFSGGEQ